MEIYDVLKDDHEKVKELLSQLLSLADDDEGGRNHIVTEVRDALIPHSRAEESVFYNSLRTLNKTHDIAIHAFKEHMERSEEHTSELQSH